MGRKEDDPLWRYAPLWAVLLGASTTLTKKMLTSYAAERKVELDWTDFATAAAIAGFTYISFRHSYGDKIEGHWYTR